MTSQRFLFVLLYIAPLSFCEVMYPDLDPEEEAERNRVENLIEQYAMNELIADQLSAGLSASNDANEFQTADEHTNFQSLSKRPRFVGKRDQDEELDIGEFSKRRMFVGKRPMYVGKRNYFGDSVSSKRRMFVGKRDSMDSIDKRPRFVGKRFYMDDSDSLSNEVAKRPRFVGKRSYENDLLDFDKRRMFVGKKAILGQQYDKRPKFVGKRFMLYEDDLDKRSRNIFAKDFDKRPKFVGKRFEPSSDDDFNDLSFLYGEVEKRPRFVGKRRMFVGKRSEEDTSSFDKRRMFVGKRSAFDSTMTDDMPVEVNKNMFSDQSNEKRRMFVGKRDNEIADMDLFKNGGDLDSLVLNSNDKRSIDSPRDRLYTDDNLTTGLDKKAANRFVGKRSVNLKTAVEHARNKEGFLTAGRV
uniref:FV-amide protein n=1 Tax=Spirobranchus lamarcki TaxID=2082999 RepID=D2WL89_SPILA|nr:FV-amide precursor protein [Spirobranchus lamarcki]